MRIEQLSIKRLTTVLLLGLGVVSIILSLLAGSYFRQAAMQAQINSLSRIIEVAGEQVLDDIRHYSIELAASLNSRKRLQQGVDFLLQEGMPAFLQQQLDDPFITGFAAYGEADLAKLRVYDLELNLLLESSKGVQNLPPRLPEELRQRATGRQGAERLKALGGLWLSPEGPFYSTLLPLGGLRIRGYLEVVIDPAFSLARISGMTRLSVSINPAKTADADGEPRLPPAENYLPVVYQLKTAAGDPAYTITGWENVTELNREMRDTQLTTTAGFLTLTFATLWLGMAFLKRVLFAPLQRLLEGIERYRQGNLDVAVNVMGGLKEVHTLAKTFNNMAAHLRVNFNELQRLSSLDGLTGIANRRLFDARLQEEWRRAERSGTPLSLLMIDIDYFKRYNDLYGHLKGDNSLKMVATTMNAVVARGGDMLARYGGEEFVVLLPGTPAEGAIVLAERLREAVAELTIEHRASAVSDQLTLSIGISTMIPRLPYEPLELIAAADVALYQAKEEGRHRIVVDPKAA